MTFTRSNPSPRYAALISAYRTLHTNGEQFLGIPPEKTFPGQSLLPQVDRIKEHILRTGACTVLDYGSGKGQQYLPMSVRQASGKEWPSIQAYWGVESVTCYDPSYEPFSQLPEGQFDGVISTDVLEHCPEEDIPWILDELFRYSRRFVFANVACYPAKKRLPSGGATRPACVRRRLSSESFPATVFATYKPYRIGNATGPATQNKNRP